MISDAMSSYLSVHGFPVPSKPEGHRPVLPEDVTLIDDEGLMNLYRDLVTWSDYIHYLLAMAAVDEKESTVDLDRRRTIAYLDNRQDGTNVTDARARSAVDEGEDVDSYARRKALEMALSSLERDTSLVSRELSRRLGERSGSSSRKRMFGGA